MSDNRYLHLVRQDCPLPAGAHAVAYCRDSGGEEQERSTQQQVEVIREYCAQHNLILERVYVDDAKQASGTEKRSELQDMLLGLRNRFKQINDRSKRAARTRTNPFGVIFWKSNRLGRDSIETRFIKADLRLRAITVIDLSRGGTGDTGVDAVLEAFQEWQDETFLDDSGQNSSRGLAEIVSLRDNDPEFRRHNPDWPTNDGRYLSVLPGIPARGFKGDLIKIGVRDRKQRREQHESHMVQRIVPDKANGLWERCYLAWKMRHEKKSLTKIMEATRLFGAVGSYAAFFANRIYMGDLEYGGKIYENFVEPLVPREWWEEEHERIVARSKKLQRAKTDPEHEPRRVASRHLLTGLVFCNAVEGEEHPMMADSIKENEKRSQWDCYICSTKKNSRGAKCKAPRVGANALNEAVIDKLMTEVLTRANLRPIADDLAQALAERNKDVVTRVAAAKNRLEDVRKAIGKLMDAIEKTSLTSSIEKRLAEREAEEREILTEIANLEAMLVKVADIPKITDQQLDAFLASMRETLMGDDVEKARAAIRRFVAKIVVNNKAGTIYYTFPLSDLSRNGTMPLKTVNSNHFLPLTMRLLRTA